MTEREEIAAALRKAAHWCECIEDCGSTVMAWTMTSGVPVEVAGDPNDLADALMPTVRALMDQAAARALEDAADAMAWPNSQNCGPWLRDRARALTATEETP